MCKIICPQCFSKDLHKFGKDPKTSDQKYRCKHCKRQFTTNSNSSQRERKPYPKCPICGKGTYLHHDYKYLVLCQYSGQLFFVFFFKI
jgi:transposase-like protein